MARRLRILLALGVVAACGCGYGQTPHRNQRPHPSLAHLGPPPLNQPLTSFAAVKVEGSPALPDGVGPALCLVRDGRLIVAHGSISGHLTVRDARIELTNDDEPPVQILYRLPQGLSMPPGSSASGRLSDLHGPGTADRRILVRSDGSLLFARLVLTGTEPVTAELGPGLRLLQRPAPQSPQAQGPIEVQVVVEDAGHAGGPLPLATPTRIQTPAGAYQVFIETSRYVSSSEKTDPPGRGYTLEAWVVRSVK